MAGRDILCESIYVVYTFISAALVSLNGRAGDQVDGLVVWPPRVLPCLLQRGVERVRGLSIINECVAVDAKFKSSTPSPWPASAPSSRIWCISEHPRKGPGRGWAVYVYVAGRVTMGRRLCEIITIFGSPD